MRRRTSFTPDTLRQLTMKADPWLSCDDCFDQADAVVDDLLLHDVPMREAFRAHLRGCPACHQETRALLELAAEDDGRSPALTLARFDAEVAATTGDGH